jgi:AbiV family abortive infection protein
MPQKTIIDVKHNVSLAESSGVTFMSIKIPLPKIKEGIKLAFQKCDEHLRSAEILASKGALPNAVVCLEFGIEEFGRAIALIEEHKAGSEDIETKLFTDHDYKYNKAWTVLPQSLKTIYEGSFDPAIFDPNIFDVGKETISPRTRLDATYVSYDKKLKSGKWEFEPIETKYEKSSTK